MLTGTVQWTAQERVVHGKPAAETVPAEIERIGATRVLLLTTQSLTNSRLIRDVTSALGDRCVGPVRRDTRPLAALSRHRGRRTRARGRSGPSARRRRRLGDRRDQDHAARVVARSA